MVECLATHLASRLTDMRAAGDSALDWRQTVTHRELSTGVAKPVKLTAEGQTEGSKRQEPLIGGPSSGANRAPGMTGNDVRADGDGQKATPIQA
jgi:hypothetical protein